MDYKSLEKNLVLQYSKVIKEFSHSEANRKVYVLVFHIDPYHGGITLYINNEIKLKDTTAEYQKKYPNDNYTEDGLRYSSGDFSFEYHADDLSLIISDLLETYQNVVVQEIDHEDTEGYWDELFKFTNVIKKTLQNLEKYISLLDKTNHFTSYIEFHETDEEDEKFLLEGVELIEIDNPSSGL
ncbi:DUF4303 domain-containing protein [Brevibacillus laterosporus]|uniref:DUF4303 domain-containing protein n=1 Tax=Brevibacillus laterosporus TaxID=1465 RepID=A0AAP8U656_BRELA|nr:DUF4303 domain-containing protein [Brevibacillus laterosporus]PPB08826.1 hypothetical protein C4A77_05940 [Brevibacillus laterosporus]